MIQRFPTGAGGLNSDGQILLHLGLANKLLQALGPQLQFKGGIVFHHSSGNQALAFTGFPGRTL
ncbi:hypothetical protein D3C83_219080 [compost metagenome]